jgi:hypothetical protein
VIKKRILLSPRINSSEVMAPAGVEMLNQFYVMKSAGLCQRVTDYVSVNLEVKESFFTIGKIETMFCRL